MSQPRALAAWLSVVLLALCPGGRAETIFRCGNSYSQTPCAGAAQINVDDARDPARKKEVDDATQRDAKLAKELEQERLKAQQAASRPEQRRHEISAQVSRETPLATTLAAPTLLTPKRPVKPGYKPKGFVALVPGSDVKAPARKKAVQKRAAASS